MTYRTGITVVVLICATTLIACVTRPHDAATVQPAGQQDLWPQEIRLFGNGVWRAPIPEDVTWIKVTPPSDMTRALHARVVTVDARSIAADGADGVDLTALNGEKEIWIEAIDSELHWSLSDVEDTRRNLSVINKRHGRLERQEVPLVLIPAVEVELEVGELASHGDEVMMQIAIRDFNREEIIIGGGRLWAEAPQQHRDLTGLPTEGEYVDNGVWRLRIPRDWTGHDWTVHYKHENFKDAYLQIRIDVTENGILAHKIYGSADAVPVVKVPDYSGWQRIGPVLSPDFQPSAIDPPHSAGSVYAEPSAVEYYRSHGTFPVGTILVKESEPVAVLQGTEVVQRESLLELGQFVGGEPPNWVYAAEVGESLPPPSRKLRALHVTICFTCHFNRGQQNVFLGRYPDLLQQLDSTTTRSSDP